MTQVTIWVWLSATALVGYLAVRLFFGGILSFGAGAGRHRGRTTTVLIGLPDSGKTALFSQLVRRAQLQETRTSMRENVGPLLAAKEQARSDSAAGVTIIDCPGHPRLREHMLRAVRHAVNIVVVVDAVTVQDGQQDGVAALAELLLTVLQSPEFYGVRRLLFVCTKRDAVTSYAAKAVRRLLEAAMVASIASRQNAMGKVESIRDANNTVIGRRGGTGGAAGGNGRRYMLSIDGAGGGDAGAGVGSRLGGAGANTFSFEQLGIPVAFVDASSRPHPSEHRYSTAAVEEFLLAA